MSTGGVSWIEHQLVAGVRAISTLGTGRLSDFGNTGNEHAREALIAALADAPTPRWMKQVHGAACVDLDESGSGHLPEADAAIARTPGVAAVVLTADCLPVLLASRDGSVVAAIHAGWRGLASGVIAATVQRMQVDPGTLVGAFGPAIGPEAFEVGPEVREAFLRTDAEASAAFRPGRGDRWHADLYRLAQQQLTRLGVAAPVRPGWCTRSDARFHSWRRDGVAAGRMAHLIWRTSAAGNVRSSSGPDRVTASGLS